MRQATFIGRLGKYPETRSAGSSTVTKVSLAVDQGKDIDPMWISVDIWGKRGEVFARFHSKGDGAAVSGDLKRVDKDGKTYLNLENASWSFLPKQTRQSENRQTHSTPDDGQTYSPPDGGDYNDDLPF